MSALDEILSDKPVHLETKKTMNAARAELTALRESVTRLKARNDELEQREIGYNAEIERRDLAMEELAESVVDLQHEVNTLRARAAEYDRIAELSEARNFLEGAIERDRVGSTQNKYWRDLVSAWLSATVPAPQDAQP